MSARPARPQIAFSLGRGLGLIAAFVILGIVLLQVADKTPSFGGGGGRKSTPTLPSRPTTSGGATSTTASNSGARPPAQVHVVVLNAGAAGGAAGNKTNQLRALGYQTDPAGNAQPRRGTAVACRQGFDKEARVLASQVGPGTNVEPFPNPAPTGVTDAVNCAVLLGQA